MNFSRHNLAWKTLCRQVERQVISKLTRANAVHVARGSSYLAAQNILVNGILIISFAILSRLISTEQMGIIAVLTLVNGACVVIGTLSLPNAVIKFMAQFLSRDDKASTATVFYQALRITFMLSLPLAAGVYVAAPMLARLLLQQASNAIYLRLLSLDIVVFAGLLPILNAAFLGLQRFKQQAIIFTVSNAVRQALIVALIIWLRNFLGLLIAWVSSDLIVSLVSLLYVSHFG